MSASQALVARAPATVRRPALRVVPRPRHHARYVVLLVAVAVAGVIGVVSLSALAAEASFQARALQSEVSELSLRYDELTAEVAGLERPERIRAVAEREIGMVPAVEPGFLLDGDAGATPAGLAYGDLADRVKAARNR